MTDFTIILRSLRARLFSTVVTAITVAVAVGLMLVLLSMSDAGRQAFERGSGNMHLLVSRDGSSLVSVLNGVFYANAPRSPIKWEEYERIAASHPFEYVIPVQLGDSYRAQWPAVATTEEYFTKFMPAEDTAWKFAAGGPFKKEMEIVLGSAVARATGHRMGDKLVLTHGIAQSRQSAEAGAGAAAPHVHDEFKYTVVGILEPTGTIHDRAVFTNLDSTWLIHTFDRWERESGGGGHDHAHHDHEHDHDHGDDDHTHEAQISLSDISPADKLITNIYIAAPSRRGSNVSAAIGPIAASLVRDTTFNPALTVASPSTEIGKLFRIVSNVDVIFVAMSVVVMVSSGIGIMLSLYNSMNERRRQIAVLRVLGCSRGRVFGLVVTESAVIGMIGAVAGVAVAIVGGWLVAAALKEQLGLVVTPVYSPRVVLTVLMATVGLAAVAGVVPAVLAYRTPVANNLRPIG